MNAHFSPGPADGMRTIVMQPSAWRGSGLPDLTGKPETNN